MNVRGGLMEWTVQISIPVRKRLVSKLDEKALAVWLARALGKSFRRVPAEVIAKSAMKLKADVEKEGLRLVGPDGKEISSKEARPFKL